MIRRALAALLGAALYGFSLVSAHSELYASRNLLKFPLLLVTTAAVCATSWWISARWLNSGLSFRAVQQATWTLFHDASLLLASASPIVLFFAHVLRATDDGQLGGYDGFLACNLGAVALAGVLAFHRQVARLLRSTELSRRRAFGLAIGWLALALCVGGQAAFYMRPFFGFPVTRGNTPPFFLGAEPDARGATNFFEALAQAAKRPPLPSVWPSQR